MSNTKFYTSISNEGFTSKPTKPQIANLHYNIKELCVDDLIGYVSSGHCFCNIYNLPSDFQFKGDGIKINNYIGSYTINIDLDHQSLTMSQQYEKSVIKPTFCYESWSNAPDDLRYRFIYVFEDMISGKQSYEDIFRAICFINGLKFDSRATSSYQYMNGTSQEAVVIKSGCVYNYKSMSLLFNLAPSWSGFGNLPKPLISQQQPGNINGFGRFILTDKDFEEDYQKMPSAKLLEKYRHRYRNIQHSPLPQVSAEEPMIDFPPDFYEITRKWSNKAGEKGRCVKYTYGEHRKHKLFVNLMVRRLICPDLSPEELLYDLVYELHYYHENSDGLHFINRQHLIDIATRVMGSDLSQFHYRRPRERMVNPKYQRIAMLPKRTIANIANAERCKTKREKIYQHIGELYDCNLTIAENLRIMKEEYGLEVSIRTLERFRKENGLARKYTMRKNTEENTISA